MSQTDDEFTLEPVTLAHVQQRVQHLLENASPHQRADLLQHATPDDLAHVGYAYGQWLARKVQERAERKARENAPRQRGRPRKYGV